MGTGKRKIVRGKVVSDKMDKTIVVETVGLRRHPFYEKVVKIRKKFYADDPKENAKEGDLVEIVETRPLSKLKRWRLVRILQSTGR